MFEHALVNDAGRTSKPWTVSLSASLQIAATAAVLIYPLIHIEKLPPVKLSMPGLRARAVKLVEVPKIPENAVVVSSRVPLLPIPNFRRPVVVNDTQLFDDTNLPLLPSDGGNSNGVLVLHSTVQQGFEPPKPPPAIKRDPPPVKTPANLEPVRVGGNVRQPELIAYVKPVYPPLARQARIQGAVHIEAVISRNGAVRSVRVVSGHPLLIESAVNAVRQWRYRPTALNGEPVEVALSLEVNFTLSGN